MAKSDKYLQVIEGKRLKANSSIENKLDKLRNRRAADQREIEKLEAVIKGIDKSYESYENESMEERIEREYKGRLREYLKSVRFDLTGKRGKDAETGTGLRLFNYLYTKWSRDKRPKAGVRASREALAKAARCGERNVGKQLTRMRHLKIISFRQGGGMGRGRSACSYRFPSFPDPAKFAMWFKSTYDPNDYLPHTRAWEGFTGGPG